MGRREHHMSQTDLFSWNMERDPALRSTIVSVLVLDARPDWDRLVRTFDRGTRVVSRLRDRLVGVPFGLAPPRWEPDPDFDLFWHLRRAALPEPANVSEVLDFARTEAMTAFDPIRPLWRATLLAGLDDGASALVLALHHSLTDGVGGIEIATEVLDFDRAGTARGHPRLAPPDDVGLLRDIVAWNWEIGTDLFRGGVEAALPAVRRAAAHPARTAREGSTLLTSLVRLVRPVTTTMSPLMVRRSTRRELAILEVSLGRLHRAARAVGCTVNDAFLTAVVIGLRTYHSAHGTRVRRLRLTMPISLRTSDDPLGGNRITLARIALPVDIPRPEHLMSALHSTVGRWRREPAIRLSHVVAAALNRLPVGLLTDMLEHVDFVASDVPGLPVPMYLAGARVERVYAFGPTTGTAVNVTMTSHLDLCCVAINADTAAIPDVGALTACLAEGFERVLELADEPESGADSAHTTSTTDRETAPGR